MSQRRVWIRLELFEHFALQLQSRCLAKLSLNQLTLVISSLRQLDPQGSNEGTETMRKAVSYELWKKLAGDIFLWKENECRSFWLILVFLHHQLPLENLTIQDPSFLLEEDYYIRQDVPLFKLIVFLFIHTDQKQHSKQKPKQTLEAFNAVWRRNDQTKTTESHSPIIHAAPGSPSSPHSIGLKDRASADAHYFDFVKANLDTLFVLLFDPTLSGAVDIRLAPGDVDLLGFLFCGGESFLKQYPRFSQVYPKWHSEPPQQVASKICKWMRKYISLNDALYPPVGFSLSMPTISLPLHVNVLQDMEVDQDDSGLIALPRPLVLASISKTTVIKRAEEFSHGDLVIFGCQDVYIYVLGPLRHVSIVASSNCKIVLAPNSGIFTVDRCEGIKVSAVCALLRVNNCLDSSFNVYTPRRSIFTGDNRGLQIGPFNAPYPQLVNHLNMSGFLFVPQSPGHWDKFINLETDTDLHDGAVKDAVVLQQPHQYLEVSIPIKMEPTTSNVFPFSLPQEFIAVVHKMHEDVETLRRLIASDDFDPSSKRVLEQAIQARFKEWLVASGNTRQVLDLVQLEKSRPSH